jgi:hypothetical protein
METTFEYGAGRDKDLADDMLKLVRYKILFVRREYEVAFPEQEDLVSDNMNGSAFSAWKVAEFIQQLHREETRVPAKWQSKKYPKNARYRKPDPSAPGSDAELLLGIDEEDKKYLRVYYEVLDRYPREKFKHEEQQIKVLEEIRAAIGKARDGGAGAPQPQPQPDAPLPDPFDEMLHRLRISAETFGIWRDGFARHAAGIGQQVAAALNAHRAVGFLQPPLVDAVEVRAALAARQQPFDRVSFDRFTGPAKGDLRIYRPIAGQPPEELRAPPVHSIWGETRHSNGQFLQRITGSNIGYVNPDDLREIWRRRRKAEVDLTFNAYTPELGMVSWASFHQNHDNQLRSIGYEMNGKVLWINQLMNPDMTPTIGELVIPGAPAPPMIVNKDQFVVSVDWEEKGPQGRFFNVYAMHIDFNFERGTATFAGRILEMRNEVVRL